MHGFEWQGLVGEEALDGRTLGSKKKEKRIH